MPRKRREDAHAGCTGEPNHNGCANKVSYSGSIAIWRNWRQGWGFIRADQYCTLPPRVTAKLEQQRGVLIEGRAAADRAPSRMIGSV